MQISAVNTSSNPLPAYAREGDAGMDLRAAETIIIGAGAHAVVGTGLRLAIPPGFVGLIWPRSGLAAKHAVDTLAGVIDSSYRGTIGVVLINHGRDVVAINHGDRIAQLLIQPIVQAELVPVASLDDTDRGAGSFGSTGDA
jgi:dUTP pyrophosphatase